MLANWAFAVVLITSSPTWSWGYLNFAFEYPCVVRSVHEMLDGRCMPVRPPCYLPSTSLGFTLMMATLRCDGGSSLQIHVSSPAALVHTVHTCAWAVRLL